MWSTSLEFLHQKNLTFLDSPLLKSKVACMRAKPLPSLEFLNECFDLDETCPSGLRWKIRPKNHFTTSMGWAVFNGRDVDKPAGCLQTNSQTGKQYWIIKVGGSSYCAHRVVYSLHHKVELSPDTEIDHEDNNGLNNSHDNLRLATRSENQHNVKLLKNNTSGSKGVFRDKKSNTWRGSIQHEGKKYALGSSPSLEVMAEIVRELREKLHRNFCNHG